MMVNLALKVFVVAYKKTSPLLVIAPEYHTLFRVLLTCVLHHCDSLPLGSPVFQ